MSILGQMVDDIKLATDGNIPYICYNEFANVHGTRHCNSDGRRYVETV